MSEAVVDSREVLENIRTILEDYVEEDDSLEIFNRVIDLAKKRIDDYGLLKTELEIFKTGNEWIDVNDRLPDKKGIYYLCTIEFLINGVKTISVNRLMFLTNNNFETWHDKMRVLAWKPLPEPYERRENKDD